VAGPGKGRAGRTPTLPGVTVLDAAWWVVCVVLVASGATKLVDPSSTETVLSRLGVRVPGGTGRALALVELAAGVGGLVLTGGAGRAVAVLVALAYLGFAGVVLAARRAGLDDCGCIGVRPRRPTLLHAGIDVASAAVAAAAAVVGPTDLAAGLGSVGMPWSALVGLAVAVAAGLLVALPGD